jgi:hypothetical protein
VLRQFPELVGFGRREAEHVWWAIYPYEKRSPVSDAIAPNDLTWWQRRSVATYCRAEAVADSHELRRQLLALLSTRKIRYLDKTISNCFHLAALRQIYPDASFIYLVRDPRDNIASMIEGWDELDRFGKAELTPLIRSHGGTLAHWTYPAPPGWLDHVTDDVPHASAWSWKMHASAILEGMRHEGGVLVRYEDLVKDLCGVVRDLADRLSLTVTPDVLDYVAAPPVSRTVVSAPDPEKWRRWAEEIENVLPSVSAEARALGYDLVR